MRIFAMTLLSGVLFALSLPPFDGEWLGWFAFVPLFVAVAQPDRRPLHALGLGLLTAIFAGVVQVRWHPNADGLRYAYLPFLWIGLVLGTTCAFAALARSRWHTAQTAPYWAVCTAGAGVAVEWLTTFSPLPVGVALCQYRTLPILQIASVTGIWGVSFLLYLTNATLADLWLRPRAASRPLLAGTGALMGAAVGFGLYELAQPVPGQAVRVAAVQDFSGGETAAYSPESVGQDTPDADTLMRQAARNGARLIVGSEGGLGSAFAPDDPKDETNRLARQTGVHLVVGYQATASPKDFNSAALIGPDGRTQAVHHKMRPFLGERASIQAGEHATVSPPVILQPPLSYAQPVRIGLLICFDTCYPAIVRQAAQQGASIIAVPNYDPPTPRMALHHLHSALMPFRAVENRVALVRADPSGRSMIVDPQGRILTEAPLFQAAAPVANVRLRAAGGASTPYVHLGDWFAYLCGAGAAAVLLTMTSLTRHKPREGELSLTG